MQRELQPGVMIPLVIFNSLGWTRRDVVNMTVNRPDLAVVDAEGVCLIWRFWFVLKSRKKLNERMKKKKKNEREEYWNERICNNMYLFL